jgi:hypothetical protein
MVERHVVLASLFAFACGPSLTTVHEGTIRFEHCNRLDLDAAVGKNDCTQCWRTWLADYTYGQPRDRIDYARKRARQLSNGHDTRPVLNVDSEVEHPAQRQFYLVVPGPTSLRTPPPPIATVVQSGGPDGGTLAKTAPEPPAENCSEACRATWQKCSGKTCGADYSTCMKHCFE